MKQKKRGSRLLTTVPLSPGLKSKIIPYSLSHSTYKSRKTKCDGREKRKAIFEAKTKCAQKSRLLPPSGQNTSVVQTPFESCLNDAFLLNFLLKYHLKPIANLAKIVSLHSSYAASLYSVPSAFLNSMMSV